MTAKKTSKPKAKRAPRGKGKPLFTPKAGTPPNAPPDPDKETDASQPLPNARHERFCYNLAMHGMSQAQAYTLAGYSGDDATARTNAPRLLANACVRDRLTFLQHRAAALAIDAAKISREDVINMILEQHQRNIGVRPVVVSEKVKDGKQKGQTVMVEKLIYNEHAANQTLKMLGDEWAVGEGASANRGEDKFDIAARAGVADPQVAADLEKLGNVRRLILAGGKDVEKAKTGEAITPSQVLRELAGK